MRRVLYILGLLTDADVDWLAQAGTRLEIPAGRRLVQAGEPTDSIYIVGDGKLSVLVGADEQVVATLGAGEIVGEISLLDSRPPTASVVATVNSIALQVSRTSLEAKLKSDSEFAARFYQALAVFLAQRLRQTIMNLGYGQATSLDEEDASDDVDPEILDRVTLAGARFTWILDRLKGS